MLAARDGHADAARVMLGQGANPESEDNEGMSAFSIASSRGHANVAGIIQSHLAMKTIDDMLVTQSLHI